METFKKKFHPMIVSEAVRLASQRRNHKIIKFGKKGQNRGFTEKNGG
jgi:hypothetical protein